MYAVRTSWLTLQYLIVWYLWQQLVRKPKASYNAC